MQTGGKKGKMYIDHITGSCPNCGSAWGQIWNDMRCLHCGFSASVDSPPPLQGEYLKARYARVDLEKLSANSEKTKKAEKMDL